MIRIHSALKFSCCLVLALVILLIPFERQVDAHAYSAGYTTVTLTQSALEMTYALDDLSVIELIGGDDNKNGKLEASEFAAVKDLLEALLQENLLILINNKPQEWTQVHSLTLEQESGAEKAVLKVSFPPVQATQSVSLTDHLYSQDAAANYVNLLTIHYGSSNTTQALSGKYREWSMVLSDKDYAGLPQDLQITSEGSDSTEVLSGWFSFFKLGMNHILSGYDHLLFLFSLLLARQTFKQYAAMITAFTVAHSITLTLTVLGIISLSPRIVEPAIALSICFVAIDNMIRKEVSYRWVLTFLFGLIHGMGFADILTEMELPKSQLAVDLVSFNLGIEAVQVILIAILLPVLGLLHKWRFSRRAVLAGSSIAFLLGGVWLLQRLVFA
ncbi:HupE/UreJ family protein [Paenibacillus sp. GCM10012306]|uniref:HupE/UreJ family protein n=1 Tax=Paenibacillus sp. GCM10012306 TaxID=3317342 RepID=UPI00362370CC